MSIKSKLIVIVVGVTLILGVVAVRIVTGARRSVKHIEEAAIKYQILILGSEVLIKTNYYLQQSRRLFLSSGELSEKRLDEIAVDVDMKMEKLLSALTNCSNQTKCVGSITAARHNFFQIRKIVAVYRNLLRNGQRKKIYPLFMEQIEPLREIAVKKISAVMSSQTEQINDNYDHLLTEIGVVHWGMDASLNQIKIARNVIDYVQTAQNIHTHTLEQVGDLFEYLASGKQDGKNKLDESTIKIKNGVDSLDNIVRMQNRFADGKENYKVQWENIENLKNYHKAAVVIVDDLRTVIQNSRSEKTLSFLDKKLEVLINNFFVPAVDRIANYGIVNLEDAHKQLSSRSQSVERWSLIILSLLFVLFVLFVWQGIIRGIFVPLDRIKQGTKIIGSGKLDYTFEVKGSDELGALALSFNQMLTTLRTAQAVLCDSEKISRTLVENYPDIIYTCNHEGIITFVSPQISKLGFSMQEMVGHNLVEFIHPDDVGDALCHLQKTLAGKEGIPFICRFFKKDNNAIYFEDLNRTIKSNGEVMVLGVLRDISERRKMEEQLLQAQRLEPIGILAGGIAHDFNNLLTSILGYSALILSNLEENNPLREDIMEIKNNGERAAVLTQQLLAFSRKQILQTNYINIDMLVKEMDRMLSRLIGEDIQLETILGAGPGRTRIDPVQIQQVILNLAVNARDALPSGGKITIATDEVIISEQYCQIVPQAQPGKFIHLSVRDNGSGMSKEILQRIFEPFFTTKTSGKGTGLGLSTVQGIVKQHKGWINVVSELGRGSTFNIYLPVITEIEQETVADKEQVGAVCDRKCGKRILIVEDDENVRKLTMRILEKTGFSVFAAQDGIQAFQVFSRENKNIDLLFCDVVLPNKDGIQLFNELQRAKPDLKVVFTSGYTDEKSQFAYIQQKGFKFLPKPYTDITLPPVIRETLQN